MKHLILIALLIGIGYNGIAQENRRERIKSLKVAYLTEKLDLSPEEAAAFWPVYNEYEDNTFELKATLGKTLRKIVMENSEAISEQEAVETHKRVMALREEIAKAELNFQKKTPQLLGAKKALYLDIYQERFKRELLKKFQERRNAGKKH